MSISSMTGYARAAASHEALHWQWEVKSVNGKALDLRFRLPAGFEGLEPALRTAAAQALRRGNLQVSLTVSGSAGQEVVRLNRAVLEEVIAAGELLRDRIGGEALRADQLLALRGVLDVETPEIDEASLERRNAAMLASFAEALAQLAMARREEGARLAVVIHGQLARIDGLVQAARDNPSRTPETVKGRLAEQVARLMESGGEFDRDRLHQEAVLLATRADIQEEIDRLFSHVEAARDLVASGEAVGRKFDFLAQEFNREANTLCSKSTDRTLTAVGLDLKTVIDQMREQVQNIE